MNVNHDSQALQPAAYLGMSQMLKPPVGLNVVAHQCNL